MLTAATAAMGTGAVLAQGPWGNGYGPGWWVLLIPLFWILVIGLVIFAVRRTWFRGHRLQSMLGAEGVLRERYARGEVDETEFRQRLEVLRSPPPK
jgi:putative membrane protein